MEKIMGSTEYPGPNDEVLEAQARICTGPHQSRPLGKKEGDPRPERILQLIAQSARGELAAAQRVSMAQMGAFFAAMTIRRGFGEKTGWSAAEQEAMAGCRAELEKCLPSEVLFLLHPEGGYRTAHPGAAQVAAALGKVLRGQQLNYEETRRSLAVVLADQVGDAWKAALLIGQRMNLESYDEVCGYLDAVSGPADVLPLEVDSLTHFGQPFDGATRYFRPTLFVAAVRAALGRASVLHGVDEMPPKCGVTEEQILRALGACTEGSREEAANSIQDPEVGFAYLSQRVYAPGAYRLRALRLHIKKRPPWATTEKAQQLFSCPHRNYMVVGFYHAGYEEKLLRLLWERGFDAGMVVKGEEGSSHYALRLGQPSTAARKAVNHTRGFRRVEGARRDFAADVDPGLLGFEYPQSPRPEKVSAAVFAQAGMAALAGARGHIYDRIVLNAAMVDYWLGLCAEAHEAVAQARAVVDSGRALGHLQAYIERCK